MEHTTMDAEDFKALKQIGDALGKAQARNWAHQYVLMEVVRDLARASPDPHKYLAGMFERISARADQAPIEREAHPVSVEFRQVISTFFAKARQGLAK